LALLSSPLSPPSGALSFALVLYYLLRCDTSSIICSFISRIAPLI
jgi:hypothetical protein